MQVGQVRYMIVPAKNMIVPAMNMIALAQIFWVHL
jgi:hypothetical protein